jgi:hypothetical protein
MHAIFDKSIPGPSIVEPELSTHFAHAHQLTFQRSRLNTEVFGGSLPSELGTLSSVTSPVAGLTSLDTCEKIAMVAYTAEPRVWTPTSPNGDLFLLYQGHDWSYNQGNYEDVLQQLLTAGYTVVGFVMPGGDTVTSGTTIDHNFDDPGLDEFVGPVVIAINTLQGDFTNIYMSGISGGGWATHLAAAVDTRIDKSYAIAGSLPLYMTLLGAGQRDHEQLLPGITASYQDLYLLGACPSRRHKQILYDDDNCCFSQADYETGSPYETFIENLATTIGGDFDLVFKTKTVHEWDTTIINDEVLAEL